MKRILIISLGVLGTAGSAIAQIPDLLNTIDAGSRSMGAGGAFGVTSSDTMSILNNPAGIGFLTNKEVITATDINLTAISDSKMNMYASIADAPGERADLRYFISLGVDTFIGPGNYPTEFAAMKKILNDFSMEFLTDYYGSEASRITSEISGLERDIRKNNKDIKQNTRKARKKSSEVASGMQAKNTSLQMENDQKRIKIVELSKEIENIKVKQAGLSRN